MYNNFSDLLKKCNNENKELWQVILDSEIALNDTTKEKIFESLDERYSIMQASATKALTKPLKTVGNLISGTSLTQSIYASGGNTIGGDFLNRVMAMALSGSEVNASMGKICAAPTAGACGILPAVLIGLQEEKNITREDILLALLTASGVGAVVVRNATVSGAEGGCQAECGVAAAMASAAAVQLMGGSASQCLDGFSLALINSMGLVCDPVAGLVQVPCAQRNASQSINAILSADLALAGMKSPLPHDEIVEAMYKTGKMLPLQLRETAMGGIAATTSAKNIEKSIFGK